MLNHVIDKNQILALVIFCWSFHFYLQNTYIQVMKRARFSYTIGNILTEYYVIF